MPVLTINHPLPLLASSIVSFSNITPHHWHGLDNSRFTSFMTMTTTTTTRTDPRITVMIIILIISLIAVSFPAISNTGLIRIPRLFFFVGKHFGTGVILATAFIHLLPDSFSSLMLDVVKEKYGNVGRWTGLIILGSLLVIFLVEYISTTYVDRLHAEPSAPPTPIMQTSAPLPLIQSTSVLQEPTALIPLLANSPKIIRLRSNTITCICAPGSNVCVCMLPPAGSEHLTIVEGETSVDHHHHGHVHHSHGDSHRSPHEEHHRIGRRRQIVGILVLQLGIMIHSLVIGLTLSVTSGADFTSLTTAIIFHQLFEGLSLGIRIAALPPKKSTHTHGGDPSHSDDVEGAEGSDDRSRASDAEVTPEGGALEGTMRPSLQATQSDSQVQSLHYQDLPRGLSHTPPPPQSAYPQIQGIIPHANENQPTQLLALDTRVPYSIAETDTQDISDPPPILFTSLSNPTFDRTQHDMSSTVPEAQPSGLLRRNSPSTFVKSSPPLDCSSLSPDSRSGPQSQRNWRVWKCLDWLCCKHRRERRLREGECSGNVNGVDEERRRRSRKGNRRWHVKVNSLKLTLSLLFGITTPLGMAIGMAVWRKGTKNTDEAQMNLIQGLMSAISAGMLIYASTVEMIAGDFVFGDVEGHHHHEHHERHHSSAEMDEANPTQSSIPNGPQQSGGGRREKPEVFKASLGKKALAVISLLLGVVGMVLVGLGEKD